MKKSVILVLCYCISVFSFSQHLGINTSKPKATLDVKAYSTAPNTAEGIIVPKMTCAQLKAKNSMYLNSEDYLGTIVFITEADCGTNNDVKTEKIVERGLYAYSKERRATGEVYLWKRLDLKPLNAKLGVEISSKTYTGQQPDTNQTVLSGEFEFRLNKTVSGGATYYPLEIRYRQDLIRDLSPSNVTINYMMESHRTDGHYQVKEGGGGYYITMNTTTRVEKAKWRPMGGGTDFYLKENSSGSLVMFHLIDTMRNFYYRITFFFLEMDTNTHDKSFVILVEKY